MLIRLSPAWRSASDGRVCYPKCAKAELRVKFDLSVSIIGWHIRDCLIMARMHCLRKLDLCVQLAS